MCSEHQKSSVANAWRITRWCWVVAESIKTALGTELNHGARRARWLRPNLQYVAKPDGTGKIPDAFVIGL